MGKISGVREWIMATKPNSINQLLITNDLEIVYSNFIHLGQQRKHEQMKPLGKKWHTDSSRFNKAMINTLSITVSKKLYYSGWYSLFYNQTLEACDLQGAQVKKHKYKHKHSSSCTVTSTVPNSLIVGPLGYIHDLIRCSCISFVDHRSFTSQPTGDSEDLGLPCSVRPALVSRSGRETQESSQLTLA